MSKIKLIYLKNQMPVANSIANVIGVWLVNTLMLRIWEARNKKGEMLGKAPILNTIRQNASSGATQIMDAIFDTVDKWQRWLKNPQRIWNRRPDWLRMLSS
jgi:hypothetical protein